MKKPSIYLKTFSLLLSLGLVMSASAMAIAGFKPNSSSHNHQKPSETLFAGNKGLRFRNRNIRASRWRTAGFSRGSGMCYGEEVEVTPLVPKVAEKNTIPVEVTALPNPTFLVYVGETQAKEAEFALLSPDKEIIYHEIVSLNETPGIVMFTLPEPMTEEELLKESEKYQWVFSLSCEQGGDASGNLTVEGWVERVSPETELAQKLANASEREKPAIFAEYGFWMDAAGILAQLRQDYTNDPQVQENWQSALNFAGLDQLIEEPLVSHSGSTGETNAEN
ncbi:MAG: DUF928 domain-containing protein [Coleofasciculus sp. D1-CHI-01]|uniref:DUF928 domain-containing protein n=1 Tax=Coleofasciculus sp. D1-CHI-01 TaxID=3068482 RepID=UPI0032F89439